MGEANYGRGVTGRERSGSAPLPCNCCIDYLKVLSQTSVWTHHPRHMHVHPFGRMHVHVLLARVINCTLRLISLASLHIYIYIYTQTYKDMYIYTYIYIYIYISTYASPAPRPNTPSPRGRGGGGGGGKGWNRVPSRKPGGRGVGSARRHRKLMNLKNK